MTPEQAMHWLTTKLREQREVAIAAGEGWQRGKIAEAVRVKYQGTDDWLAMQAAIASRAIQTQMLRILQSFARRDASLPSDAKLTPEQAAEFDGIQCALDGLSLRASYIVAHDGAEQATELMTGDEARHALRILDVRIADDTVSRNRLQAAIHQYPHWTGERTLIEAIAMQPESVAA